MELNLQSFFILVIFYSIGSIPFALIVQKLMATNDPRKHGSMNPGATNMYRIAGPLAGVATFLGDFFKGFIPIYVLAPDSLTYGYLFSLMLLLGHMFSIFNVLHAFFVVFRCFFLKAGSTVYCIYGFSPPPDPGQNLPNIWQNKTN